MAKSQTEEIVKYLREYGFIDDTIARRISGAKRLGSIIFVLRNKGFVIETDIKTVKNRYGTTSTPAIYRLVKDVEGLYND